MSGDGQLRLLMDTPADNFILELMMKTEYNPIVEGRLDIYDGTGDMPIRRIEFGKAYIVKFQETFDVLNGGEMITYVQISPMEMTINKRVNIERKFFWLWSKILPKPMKMAEVVADKDMHLNDVYWIKPDGTKCRDLLFDRPIKLYLKIANSHEGETFSFTFREETDEGVFHANCSGQADSKGIVIIEDFELKKES